MKSVGHNYIDLATVEEYCTKSLHVVSCPAWKARVGCMVEFAADGCQNVGIVLDSITVEHEADVWNFVDRNIGIVPCGRIWNPVRGGDNEST